MNRTILNFDATVSSNGLLADGSAQYTVRLYLNHHIVAYWDLGVEGYLLTQDRAHLDAFIAQKMFQWFRPVVTTVTYVGQ